MAAGILLVEEAGGRASDIHGGPLQVRAPHVIADNGLVHEELVSLFAEIFANEFRYPIPMIS
jgi:myo-inositol-1(or 4)-monophosphatase